MYIYMCMCIYMSLYIEVKVSCTVISDPLQSHGLWPARLHCPRNSPGKSTGVGCHFLLQGIFWLGNQTRVSCIAGRFFTNRAIREVHIYVCVCVCVCMCVCVCCDSWDRIESDTTERLNWTELNWCVCVCVSESKPYWSFYHFLISFIYYIFIYPLISRKTFF